MTVNCQPRVANEESLSEGMLNSLNKTLEPLELQLISNFSLPRYPLIFICGPQRSGTTLLMQLLATVFNIGYISNLVGRFWRAPYIGCLLARDLGTEKTKSTLPEVSSFTSDLGKTLRADDPHEFTYFWRHWFPNDRDIHEISEENLKTVNVGLFCKEIAAMESVFDAPLTFKNPILSSLNAAVLAKILPSSLFIICNRDPVYIAQSTLLARQKLFGCKERWWSIRPKEYSWLKDRPYPEQIAGQIFYTERRIKESLSMIEPRRYLFVQYEDLCKDPEKEMIRIGDFVGRVGYRLSRTGFQPDPLTCANDLKIEQGEFETLRKACNHFYQGKGETCMG